MRLAILIALLASCVQVTGEPLPIGEAYTCDVFINCPDGHRVDYVEDRCASSAHEATLGVLDACRATSAARCGTPKVGGCDVTCEWRVETCSLDNGE